MVRDVAAWRDERAATRASIRDALQMCEDGLQPISDWPGLAAGADTASAQMLARVWDRAVARMAEAEATLIDIAEHQQHLKASLVCGQTACERDYCRIIEAVETWRDMHLVLLLIPVRSALKCNSIAGHKPRQPSPSSSATARRSAGDDWR